MSGIEALTIGQQFLVTTAAVREAYLTPYEVTAIKSSPAARDDQHWLIIEAKKLDRITRPTIDIPMIAHHNRDDKITLQKIVDR